jgi:uncharacterized membrane protein YciS (DUF1049 family)
VNARLFLKLVVVLAIMLFMVMMGLSNDHPARFKLAKVGWEFEINAALMYFIFFGAGVLAGAVIASGGGKSSSSKPK